MLILGLVALFSGKYETFPIPRRFMRTTAGWKARVSGLILMAPLPVAFLTVIPSVRSNRLDFGGAIGIEFGIVLTCLVSANALGLFFGTPQTLEATATAITRADVRRAGLGKIWLYGLLFVPCLGLGLVLAFASCARLFSPPAPTTDNEAGLPLLILMTLVFLGVTAYFGLTIKTLLRERRQCTMKD
jgi:hypothetical protein